MKTIVRTEYVADDGSVFTNPDKCREYEEECVEIAEAIAPLGKKPKLSGCGFENGDGYLSHAAKTAIDVRIKLLRVAKRLVSHRWIQESIDNVEAHPSFAGRLIDECGHRALFDAWYRIMCMDKSWCEWGQPYFASHPHEGKQHCLNLTK